MMETDMSNVLTKEQILKADDIVTKRVNVPQWGGEVIIKSWGGTERDEYEHSLLKQNESGEYKRDLANIRAKACSLSIVDEEGNRLFTLAEANALGRKSGEALSIVFEEVQVLNKLRPQDRRDALKNSEPGPSDGSISA